ncbi:ribonuclease T2 family protein [Biscogniauxia marginata]|nr:ribonuclease T2 family protein [Biscogniauxia marginata]
MSAMRHILASSLLLRGALAGLYPGLSTDNHTCSLAPPVLSCSEGAQPDLVDTCCTETFGGLVLQTQFWNTYTGLEAEGQVLPKDAWTIHGLWPDFCNGSYTQYCDPSRQYDPEPYPNTTTGTPSGEPVVPWTGVSIDEFVKPFGKWDLLAYMKKFWTGQSQPSAVLWAHEFSKHATCFSNFDVECYGPLYARAPHADVADYFATVVGYYRDLPTWAWLAARGVRPSNATTYSLSDVQGALRRRGAFGRVPYVGCAGPRYNETAAGRGSADAGYTVLVEVWYYHHVLGRVQSGKGLPVDADIAGGRVTNCATTPGAIWYYERTAGSEV